MKLGLALRSALFLLVLILITPVFALIALATFPLKPLTRFRIISGWSRLLIAAARIICGIRHRILGAENIPAEPCIILSKHQSTWETLAFQAILPPHVWVLKRELLWIPFFGWGLAMLSPIAIDRGARARALLQALEQGRERLRDGFSIVIFPEGTRVGPGSRASYHPGGAWIAAQTAALVLPVAHNAGKCWPRNGFLKYPGLITVSIGPVIHTREASAGEINTRVESWIEGEMLRIDRDEQEAADERRSIR